MSMVRLREEDLMKKSGIGSEINNGDMEDQF